MTVSRCCTFVAVIWMLDASVAEAQCSYTVTPTTIAAASTSGTRTVSIVTGTQCSWTATTTDSWITVTSGATGQGMGNVTFLVAANGTGSARTGTLTVAGKTVTVTQAANSCTYSVTPSSFSIDALSTSRTLSVTAGTQCTWSATTTETWITITNPGSGIGISPVTFSVTANGASAQRVGTLTVAGQTVTVTQAGTSGGTPPTPPTNLRVVR